MTDRERLIMIAHTFDSNDVKGRWSRWEQLVIANLLAHGVLVTRDEPAIYLLAENVREDFFRVRDEMMRGHT